MVGKLIGLCGFKGSGKDTVGNCLRKHGFHKDSYASSLKDICSIIFGWERSLVEGDTDFSRMWREQVDPWWSDRLNIDDFTPRKALQLVGTNSLRMGLAQDIWVASLERRLQQTSTDIVITDCRFPNELDVVAKTGGKVIWVQKDMPAWYDSALVVAQHIYKEHIGLLEKGSYMREYPTVLADLQHQGIHESEWMWLAYPIDAVIENTATIEELQQQVDNLMETQI